MGIAATAAVIAVFGARYLGLVAPSPGPLHVPGGGELTTSAAAGSTMTAAFRLSESDLEGSVVLRSAEVVGIDDGLDVGEPQVLVCRADDFCTPSYVLRDWPPRGATPGPVARHTVDADLGTRTVVGVPVTLPEGPGEYRLRGIEVEYQQGLRRYRAEVGPNLVFVVRE